MSQLDFDFTSFHERVTKQREADELEARKGLEELQTCHRDLVASRDSLDKQIKGIEQKIHELRVFLGLEAEEKKPAIIRNRGVLAALRKVVAPKFNGIDFAEPQDIETIAEAVRTIKPSAKMASVRDSLLTLVKEGTLETFGTRGNRRWSYSGMAPISAENGLESSEVPDAEESPQEPESAPTRPHDEIVGAVVEHIMNSIPKAKDGIGAKTIAWIMAEAGADEVHFEAAVEKLQGEGKVEVGQSLTDEATVIRFPAEPDSKEELKRTRVKGNPLFPNMDQPSHA